MTFYETVIREADGRHISRRIPNYTYASYERENQEGTQELRLVNRPSTRIEVEKHCTVIGTKFPPLLINHVNIVRRILTEAIELEAVSRPGSSENSSLFSRIPSERNRIPSRGVLAKLKLHY